MVDAKSADSGGDLYGRCAGRRGDRKSRSVPTGGGPRPHHADAPPYQRPVGERPMVSSASTSSFATVRRTTTTHISNANPPGARCTSRERNPNSGSAVMRASKTPNPNPKRYVGSLIGVNSAASRTIRHRSSGNSRKIKVRSGDALHALDPEKGTNFVADMCAVASLRI